MRVDQALNGAFSDGVVNKKEAQELTKNFKKDELVKAFENRGNTPEEAQIMVDQLYKDSANIHKKGNSPVITEYKFEAEEIAVPKKISTN